MPGGSAAKPYYEAFGVPSQETTRANTRVSSAPILPMERFQISATPAIESVAKSGTNGML